MARHRLSSVWIVPLLFAAGACKSKEAPADLAPVASSLEAPKPASTTSLALAIESGPSSMTFLMDSPLEKIYGEAPGAVAGELSVDLSNVAKSTGLVKVDLDKLVLFQQKRPDEGADYGERKKSAKQNDDARSWLEIVPRDGELTPEQAAANRYAEFRIDKFEPSTADVRALAGAERKLTATASGELRVHGRKQPQSAKVELTFRFAGDKLESVSVKTLEPFRVSLEKFEIHPRDRTGKFLKTVTDAVKGSLKGLIQTEAPVTIEFIAKPKS